MKKLLVLVVALSLAIAIPSLAWSSPNFTLTLQGQSHTAYESSPEVDFFYYDAAGGTYSFGCSYYDEATLGLSLSVDLTANSIYYRLVVNNLTVDDPDTLDVDEGSIQNFGLSIPMDVIITTTGQVFASAELHVDLPAQSLFAWQYFSLITNSGNTIKIGNNGGDPLYASSEEPLDAFYSGLVPTSEGLKSIVVDLSGTISPFEVYAVTGMVTAIEPASVPVSPSLLLLGSGLLGLAAFRKRLW